MTLCTQIIFHPIEKQSFVHQYYIATHSWELAGYNALVKGSADFTNFFKGFPKSDIIACNMWFNMVVECQQKNQFTQRKDYLLNAHD